LKGKANGNPTWTPDGKWISFYSDNEGGQNLFWQLADGSGGPDRLTTSDHIQAPMSSSPDGKLLAFLDVGPATGWDIWVLRLGDRTAQPFLQTAFSESAPRFSPDGRWLAYFSNESGRFEVYMTPYPGPGRKEPISTEGGTEPVWNPNGRELFYRSGDKMMAVDIVTQPGFAVGKPHVLFEGPYVPTPLTFPNYDVSSDGQRFLMLKPTEQAQAAPTQINVVSNWFEELKQKVPVGSQKGRSRLVRVLAPMRSSPPAARGGWVKSTKPATCALTARSPSRSSPCHSPPILSSVNVSTRKPARLPARSSAA
jgi:Tol biopolymer transport system component